jgi:hypothetical protein
MNKKIIENGLSIDIDELTDFTKAENGFEYELTSTQKVARELESHTRFDPFSSITNHERMIEKALGSVSSFKAINRVSDLIQPISNHLESLASIATASSLASISGPSYDFSSYSSELLNGFISSEVATTNRMLSEYYSRSQAFDIPDSINSLLKSESFTQANLLQSQVDSLIIPSLQELATKQLDLTSLMSFDVFKSLRNQFEKVSSLTFPYESLKENFKSHLFSSDFVQSAIQMTEKQNEVIRNLIDSTGLNRFNSIEASLRMSALNAIDMTASLYTNLETDELLELNHYRQLVETESSDGISKKFNVTEFIAIMLAILFHLHSIQMNYQSSKETQKALESVESNLIGQIYVLQKQVQDLQNDLVDEELDLKVEYVVIRAINLRTQSNTDIDSHIISVLYPNQKVELLKRNKKWIYVGYFDEIDGVPKTGWVYKKYLRLIK